MTNLQNQLTEWGARLYARQVMERARVREEEAERERERSHEERARAFWSEVGLEYMDACNWQGAGPSETKEAAIPPWPKREAK